MYLYPCRSTDGSRVMNNKQNKHKYISSKISPYINKSEYV